MHVNKKKGYFLDICTCHATQSFNRPADMVITPTLVRSSLSSAKIRANTGNAYSNQINKKIKIKPK